MLKKNPKHGPNIEEVCDFINASNFPKAWQRCWKNTITNQCITDLMKEPLEASHCGNSTPMMLVPVQSDK